MRRGLPCQSLAQLCVHKHNYHPDGWTITRDEVPSPSMNRPPESCWAVAADIAIKPGGRVKTGTIAVPSRILGASIAAAASGTKASVAYDSNDQAST